MRIIGNDPSIPRQAQIVASGTLSTGDAVIVNADGTVSVVEGTDAGGGTPVTIDSTEVFYSTTTFDTNSNKVVVAYRDGGNFGYGTAVVGTVSGTSISFGSPVVFNSGTSNYNSGTFDSNSSKVVIAYRDEGNSSYGTAVVGTVSGTSISFGSPVVFESASSQDIAATFDASTNKVVITYQDQGNAGYGTAVVGTVSGTSISFGSPVVFESASVGDTSVVYNSGANNIVISYRDDGNSNYGTAIVGTVSGTSISFGSPVVFQSSYTFDCAATFDSASDRVVVAYSDFGNSSYGKAVVGTVSGTSISFGSPVVFESANTRAKSIAFDSDANRVIIFYRDNGNSGYGTAIVGAVSGSSINFDPPVVFESESVSYTSAAFDSASNKAIVAYNRYDGAYSAQSTVFQAPSTNLTSENYIGTAASGAADTQRAKINLKGAVDENQSGLTAGQSYYVQTDGTLGTTPADPSVFAGTAVGANKLIVKG